MFTVTIVVVDRSTVSALELHSLIKVLHKLNHFFNLERLSTGLHRTNSILRLMCGDTRFAKVLFAVVVFIHDGLHWHAFAQATLHRLGDSFLGACF